MILKLMSEYDNTMKHDWTYLYFDTYNGDEHIIIRTIMNKYDNTVKQNQKYRRWSQQRNSLEDIQIYNIDIG